MQDDGAMAASVPSSAVDVGRAFRTSLEQTEGIYMKHGTPRTLWRT